MPDNFFNQLTVLIADAGHSDLASDAADWLEFCQNKTSPEPVTVPVAETCPETVQEVPVTASVVPQPLSGTLAELEQQALVCRKCPLCQNRNHVVFGEGDPGAKLMFIGEGPGADEDLSGRPFVGRAGELLTKMITAMQFTRQEVYIANIVKCRPPYNRAPMPEEAAGCLPYLQKQIELIKPECIVLLGASAAHFLLDRNEGITKLRGKWLDYCGIPVMPTFHPAFLLRQESAKREAWQDLQQVMAKFGKIYRKK